MMEGIISAIDQLFFLKGNPEDDDERLLYAALADARNRLYSKSVNYQREYKVTFPAVEALALRIYYVYYLAEAATLTSVSNKMGMISNEVDQLYA